MGWQGMTNPGGGAPSGMAATLAASASPAVREITPWSVGTPHWPITSDGPQIQNSMAGWIFPLR